MSIPIDPNATPKPFNNLDWTAAAATALPTALSFYAFNAAANSKTTPSMLFHSAVGLLSLKYAYGFGSAWRENKTETTRQEYLARGIRNGEEVGNDVIGKIGSLYNSTINPPSKSAKERFADLGKAVIQQNNSGAAAGTTQIAESTVADSALANASSIMQSWHTVTKEE